MPDVDELLHSDAARWRTELSAPPALAAASRIAVKRGRGRRRSRLWVPLSVAACVGLIIGTALLVIHLRGEPGDRYEAPAAVLVDGHRIPYAGPVPWADPVTDPSDPLVIYVFADNDRIHADVCGVAADRAVVRQQTTDAVSIFVAGYANHLPAGSVCGGVGHAPVPVAVRLQRPLGNRTVLDASDGSTHTVLDAANVPAPHHIPPICKAMPLRWDEHTGVATRMYITSTPSRCLIVMQYGPIAAMRGIDSPVGAVGDPVRVAGKTAQVWRYNDVNNREVILQWSPTPDREIRLTVNASPAHPFTEAEVLAIARSIS